jgi:hypothetical protein
MYLYLFILINIKAKKGGVKLKRAILVSWKEEEDKQVMQYLSDNSLKLATLVRDLVLKKVRKVGK